MSLNRVLFGAIAAAVVLSGALPATAQPRWQSIHPADVDGLCIDVKGAKLEPSAEIILWTCHGRANQVFVYDRRAQEIRVASRPDLCVEVELQPEPPERLLIVNCDGSYQSKQHWIYDERSGVVRSPDADRCWTVPRYIEGVGLLGSRCRRDVVLQKFVFNDPIQARPLPPPPVVQAPAPRAAPGKSFYVNTEGFDEPGLCVDVPGGKFVEGARLWLWKCHQQAPQRFGLNPNLGLIFTTANNRFCVDGPARDQLRLVECEGVRHSWHYDPRTKTVRSNDGLCWDVYGGDRPENIRMRQPLIAYPCHNRVNQQFVLND